jgi:regulator of sigma E protease
VLPELLSSVFSNLWTFALAILLLGLSIFVHEMGHFLAARRRGVKVERFSIGFGPALWSRRGRDGVEYRLSSSPTSDPSRARARWTPPTSRPSATRPR